MHGFSSNWIWTYMQVKVVSPGYGGFETELSPMILNRIRNNGLGYALWGYMHIEGNNCSFLQSQPGSISGPELKGPRFQLCWFLFHPICCVWIDPQRQSQEQGYGETGLPVCLLWRLVSVSGVWSTLHPFRASSGRKLISGYALLFLSGLLYNHSGQTRTGLWLCTITLSTLYSLAPTPAN